MRRLLILVTVSVLALGALPCPVWADLFVSSANTDQVLRYNSTTGAFINAFVPAASGGLDDPRGLVFGPDGHLYVASQNTDQVLRYNGTTGAFINAFVPAASGGLDGPRFLVFQSIASAVAIPTLSEWGMIGMGMLLASLGVWVMRRRRPAA